MHDNWDYKGIHKTGVHTLGKYPAMMVPKMQLDLLKKFGNLSSNTIMLDPFMGSGTAIVEAQRLNMSSIGIDINPYAVLLAKVKTHSYESKSLSKNIKYFLEKLYNKDFLKPIWYFTKISKWFRTDIIESLSHIRNAILSEQDIWIRRFLWICMSEIIYNYSNDRSSTFKLHIKTKDKIEQIKNNVLEDFRLIVLKKYKLLNTDQSLKKAEIYLGNTKSVCSSLPNESVDIICTSPPYGDNATTVTYGQASILFLKWIDLKDISLNDNSYLIEKYTTIDRLSLGGRKVETDNYTSKLYNDYLGSIGDKKRPKVINFINDYWKVIQHLSRIIKANGVVIFTVGNRRVDGKEQPLDKITCEMFSKCGLSCIYNSSREISDKRMPTRLSHINKIGAVKSMTKEKVLVFKRKIS